MSTVLTAPSRHPAGVPIGGQFAPETRTEAEVSLTGTVEESIWQTRYDTPGEKLTAFREELDRKVAELDTDEEWLSYLDTMSKFHKYSMNNTLLIMLQRPDATRVGSYKLWQSLGRQVRKGEKGIAIFAPMRKSLPATDKDGNPILDGKGKPVREVRNAGYTTASVFDISQTDGPELPSIQTSLSETPPPGFKDDLEAAIVAEGFTVSYEELKGGLNGYTSADGSNRVVIRKGLSEGSEAAVLAHELGHIKAGHLERREEYHTGHNGQRGNMEVEAESIAYVLCRANGMQTVGDTAGTYIKGWSLRDPEALRKSGETVANATKALLTGRDWQNVEA